ncbi:hypothetical protein [Francisella frigiditurris]|uniref:Uncharacterized protein n=1 Tax=Francisella frigiditurris TaxID=1542390 RepID=A0A1J0KUU3_9GAMM|nr:hypothetical protein [Francisella frigiditurris]APC97459.1 hypothetical protein KX01_1289 [Francisella frigiditurris]
MPATNKYRQIIISKKDLCLENINKDNLAKINFGNDGKIKLNVSKNCSLNIIDKDISLELDEDEKITLKVYNSIIELQKEKIVFKSKNIVFDATNVEIKSGNVEIK